MPPGNLLDLPVEVHDQIIHDTIWEARPLRTTCQYFRALIPPLGRVELARHAERDPLAMRRDAYACKECLRLRYSSRFDDNMLQKRRRKGGYQATDRLCLDCWMHRRPGTERYAWGNERTRSGYLRYPWPVGGRSC
ncbi:hypothetical protein VPNG_09539 [Cytospora leucostoma]|uniref:F-box domain-containing protein n=1 Tax=Cytospora leucostoma TaxID=1230097 RepID=A0A423VQH1_9PEZI|nr:hypothetical protein VPNG_09539 [Cytospora leucostoma]